MRLIALSLALAAALPAQDTGKVTLEWKLKKGDTHRYEAGIVTEIDIAGNEITMEMLFGLAMEVVDVSAEGAARIKTTYDRIKVVGTGMMAGEYDSDKDKTAESPPPALILAHLLNKTFTLELSKKGECTKVEGITKLIEEAVKELPEDNPMAGMMGEGFKKQFNDDVMKSVFQVFLGFLPKEPVAAGDAWKAKHGLGGAIGKITIDAACTLKEVRSEGKEAVIKLDAKTSLTAPDGGGVFGAVEITDSKMKGEAVWRLEEGIIQSSQGTLTLDGSSGGMDFSLVQKMNLKLAPKAKK
jgi:hypothetical protein